MKRHRFFPPPFQGRFLRFGGALAISALPVFFLIYHLTLSLSAQTADFFISEIMIDGASGEEFVELRNSTSEEISLSGYYLNYYSSERDWDKPYRSKSFPEDATIPPEGYFVVSVKKSSIPEFKEDWSLDYSGSIFSNSNGSVAIFPDNSFSRENALDFVSWGKVSFVGTGKETAVSIAGKSLERIDFEKNLWQESFCLGGTPGRENSRREDCPLEPENEEEAGGDDASEEKEDESKESLFQNKVRLSELYPAPDTKAGEQEFVELEVLEGKNPDFSKWHVKDASGKKTFLSGGTFFDNFYFSEKSFSLNNDKDSVFLFDDKGFLVDRIDYSSGTKSKSFSFDGTTWRWSSQKTPGQKNEFDKKLKAKIKLQKKVYPGIYADFEARPEKGVKKFVWDFGDGKKSYLQNPRHKYDKTGTYRASLKITGDGEDATYPFKVKVEKFKAPKVEIASLLPNPEGADSGGEWIALKNSERKKVSLKNWSVASGTKNATNHPIRGDFEISPGQTKKLERKICSFSLPNKEGIVELRSPDGKTVQRIEYSRGEKPAAEGEIFENSPSGWIWKNTDESDASSGQQKDLAEENEEGFLEFFEEDEEIPNDPLWKNIFFSEEERELLTGRFSTNPSQEKKKVFRLKLVEFGTRIKAPEQLLENREKFLKASSVFEQENTYLFSRNFPKNHWLNDFFQGISKKTNRELKKTFETFP